MANSIVFSIFTLKSVTAQVYVSNPDFWFVDVTFEPFRTVRPQDWFAFENSGLRFTHPGKESQETFYNAKFNSELSGILLGIKNPGEGIFTKLLHPLDSGKIYSVNIKLKNRPLTFQKNAVGRKPFIPKYASRALDSKNWLTSIDISFTDTLPDCELDLRPYHALTLNFPPNADPDSSQWFSLTQKYKATGHELYFVMGRCCTEQYIMGAISQNDRDTTEYLNKIAYYYVTYLNITPYTSPIIELNSVSQIDSLLKKGIDLDKFCFSHLNFERDSFAVTELSEQILNEYALFLKVNPGINVSITGHTDSTGTSEHNQLLSEKRAKAVFDYLIEKRVPARRLVWNGVGSNEPIFFQEYYKNRRVEFKHLY